MWLSTVAKISTAGEATNSTSQLENDFLFLKGFSSSTRILEGSEEGVSSPCPPPHPLSAGSLNPGET